MPNLIEIPLAVDAGQGRSPKANASQVVNLYIMLEEAGSKTKSILINTQGTQDVASFNYDILGIYLFKGIFYVVTKNKLYKLVPSPGLVPSETLVPYTVLVPSGELIPGSEPVAMQTALTYSPGTVFTVEEIGDVSLVGQVSFADNGIEMVFVAGEGYSFNPEGEVLTAMSDQAGWYPSYSVAYMDGYFIFSRDGTGQFFITQLFSTILDPIDWATGEAAPDDTLSVQVLNRQLWIIGEKTCEVWYDSGDPLFPFTRISGAVVDIGAIGYQTVAKALDVCLFVGNDLKVYMTRGYSLVPVSTSSIDHEISRMTSDPSTIRAFTFHERGHWFYALTLGDDGSTFVYDLTTTLWHMRKSYDHGGWEMDGAYNNYVDGETYVYSGQKLFRFREEIFTENHENIIREIVSVPLNKTVNRTRIHELELDMEVAYPVEAKIGLELSSDSARTWGNINYAHTGKMGHSMQRVRWNRLGQHRNLVGKFTFFSAMPVRILSLNMRAT